MQEIKYETHILLKSLGIVRQLHIGGLSELIELYCKQNLFNRIFLIVEKRLSKPTIRSELMFHICELKLPMAIRTYQDKILGMIAN